LYCIFTSDITTSADIRERAPDEAEEIVRFIRTRGGIGASSDSWLDNVKVSELGVFPLKARHEMRKLRNGVVHSHI
jgi:hypothetical protein